MAAMVLAQPRIAIGRLASLLALAGAVLLLASGQSPTSDLDGFTVRFVDDRGVPLEDLEVSAGWVKRTPSSSTWWGYGNVRRTDQAGEITYAPTGKVRGTFQLSVHGDEFEGHATEATELAWDGKAGETVVVVPRLGRLRGKVTGPLPAAISYQLPQAGIDWFLPDGVAFSGFMPEGGLSASMEVGIDGSFELERMTPGPVEIIVHRGTSSIERTVHVPPGEASEVEVFDFRAMGAWVVGTVRKPDGTPAEGVSIEAVPCRDLLPYESRGWFLRSSFGWPENSVLSDGAGRFVLGPLEPGAYEVIAPLALEGAGWADARVALRADRIQGVQLELEATRTLTVTVSDSFGRPIPAARVELLPYHGHRYEGYWAELEDADLDEFFGAVMQPVVTSAATDEAGQVTFRCVPPRSIELKVEGTLGSSLILPARQSVEALAREVQVTLEPGTISLVETGGFPGEKESVSVVLLSREGVPLSSRGDVRQWSVPRAQPGGEGPNAQIIGVPPGRHVLAANVGQGEAVYLPVQVTDDEPTVVDLASFGSLCGARITVRDGEPNDVVETYVNGVQVDPARLCAPAEVDVLVRRGPLYGIARVHVDGRDDVVVEPDFRPGGTILAGFEVIDCPTAMPMVLVHESGYRYGSAKRKARVDPAGTLFTGLPPGRYAVFAGDHGSVEVDVEEGKHVNAFVVAAPR